MPVSVPLARGHKVYSSGELSCVDARVRVAALSDVAARLSLPAFNSPLHLIACVIGLGKGIQIHVFDPPHVPHKQTPMRDKAHRVSKIPGNLVSR